MCCPGIYLEGLRVTTKIFVQNVPAEFQTEDVPNTSQGRYRYAKTFGDNAWRLTSIPIRRRGAVLNEVQPKL
jgi:hypothetical protein